MINTNNYLLKVDNLKTYFPINKGLLRQTVGYIRAVDGISFGIKKSQTLGLVGESSCGKTTVAKTLIRLVPAKEGKVLFGQIDVLSANKQQLRRLRRQISMIFQDPFGSLNPRMTIYNTVGESLKVHKKITGSELTDAVAALLAKVGLSPGYMNRYPHEFSGGQCQRIGIARALVLRPKLVICDEPVSALDVSIQSQILNLLKDLQEEFGLTLLFIAHDLAVVKFFCDVVAVMYRGKIVERASTEQIYGNPLHPYTHALLSAIGQVRPSLQRKSKPFAGPAPAAGAGLSVSDVPGGCPFYPRCPLAEGNCFRQMPALREGSYRKGHFVACWK